MEYETRFSLLPTDEPIILSCHTRSICGDRLVGFIQTEGDAPMAPARVKEPSLQTDHRPCHPPWHGSKQGGFVARYSSLPAGELDPRNSQPTSRGSTGGAPLSHRAVGPTAPGCSFLSPPEPKCRPSETPGCGTGERAQDDTSHPDAYASPGRPFSDTTVNA